MFIFVIISLITCIWDGGLKHFGHWGLKPHKVEVLDRTGGFLAGFLNIGFLIEWIHCAAISGAREQHEPGEQRQQMAFLLRLIIFLVGTIKNCRGEI